MEPLEKRMVRVDDKIVPALNREWVKDTSFLPFPLIGTSHTEEELTDWITATDLLVCDLQSLLHEPCHVFWSHLIFDDTLRVSLDSFLKLMPRNLDGEIVNTTLHSQFQKLYKTFFKIFLRMTTCKESADDYFTPRIFGTILYDNYILDLPKIIDLCVLFSPSNGQLLTKMVENVFKHQPKYLDDVTTAVPSIVKLFEDLIGRLTDNKLTVPRGLTSPNPETSTADVDISDLCLYASDMCHSVQIFLHSYPPACIPFHEASFYKVLSIFYEDVLHRLSAQLESSNLSQKEEKRAYERLKLAQDDSISLFRHILFTSTLGKVSNQSDSSDLLVHEFYDILSEHLGETRFIGHYSSRYAFSKDMDFIDQLNIQSDNTRQLFIRDGLLAAQSLKEQQESQKLVDESQQETLSEVEDISTASAASNTASTSLMEQPLNISKPSPSQSVLDLFPDYGEGFIEMCLRHYNSVDHVINALLEDNLPESLANLDPTLKVPLQDDSLVSSRRNVFDNDEFDVFRQEKIDTTKIHRGKRHHHLGAEDSSYKEKIKELVSNYDEISLSGGLTAVPTFYDDNMYEDEYDDTYDANEIGADDADEALDLMGRKMVVPIALGGSGVVEDGEGDNCSTSNVNNVKATSNPIGNDKQKYDVKGRAKGQGQSADVVRNRNFKTAHKARGANHNRKAGARSKMSKGMF